VGIPFRALLAGCVVYLTVLVSLNVADASLSAQSMPTPASATAPQSQPATQPPAAPQVLHWSFGARLRHNDRDNRTGHVDIPEFINDDTSITVFFESTGENAWWAAANAVGAQWVTFRFGYERGSLTGSGLNEEGLRRRPGWSGAVTPAKRFRNSASH
jgi:hypothetical protein